MIVTSKLLHSSKSTLCSDFNFETRKGPYRKPKSTDIKSSRAGRMNKFYWRKSLDSQNFSSDFLFWNCVLLCSFHGAVEWIHKSLTAIYSEPIFLIFIWTALFANEMWKDIFEGADSPGSCRIGVICVLVYFLPPETVGERGGGGL